VVIQYIQNELDQKLILAQVNQFVERSVSSIFSHSSCWLGL